MHQRRRAKGVTGRASRSHRHHPRARGVSDAHPPGRGAGVAGHRPHCGRRGGGRVVRPDLSYRAEDCARMAQITASLVVAAIAGGAPLAGQASLSIYSDGRVVVRRALPQPLQKGRNALTIRLEGLDGATLFSPDTAVALVSAVVRPPSTPEAALAASIGQTLSFIRPRETGGADTVRASVVRSDPPQYRLSDGRFLLSPPGEPLFPPELVRTAPEAALTLEAARPRPRTELAYLADGAARWEAVYQVVLLGPKCQVSGAATITSQTLRVDSAEVQLVAGSINRARTAPRPQFLIRGYTKLAGAEETPAAASEEAVGETHVYELPGRDLRVQSGDAFDVTAERVQTDYNQEQLAPPRRGQPPRQRITAAYKVTLSNAKSQPVSVDVREARFGTWQVTESSIPAEKLSSTEVRFRVSVPANGDATLTYTVQAES